jgi:DNA-binding PadR family transcriptional regulator
MILQTIRSGYVYGFDIMEATGLPSGTIYPALRRLENDSLVRGDWEDSRIALRQERPARRYYKLTRQGKDALASAVERYPLLARMAPEEKATRR